LILDDVIEDMNFPTWKSASLPKKPGGKSKRILYQSLVTGHFFSVFDKVWQKTQTNGYKDCSPMCHFSSGLPITPNMLSLNKK
jgi:hypothetical protein